MPPNAWHQGGEPLTRQKAKAHGLWSSAGRADSGKFKIPAILPTISVRPIHSSPELNLTVRRQRSGSELNVAPRSFSAGCASITASDSTFRPVHLDGYFGGTARSELVATAFDNTKLQVEPLDMPTMHDTGAEPVLLDNSSLQTLHDRYHRIPSTITTLPSR